MEETLTPATDKHFSMTDDMQQAFGQLVIWLRINAIVSLLSFALSLCSFLYDLFGDSGTDVSAVILLLVLITLIVSGWICWLLWATSRLLKAGLDQLSQAEFEKGVRLFNQYFRTVGILSVLVMVLMALALVLMVMSIGFNMSSQLE